MKLRIHSFFTTTAVLFFAATASTAFAQTPNDEFFESTDQRFERFREKLEDDLSDNGPKSVDYRIWRRSFDAKKDAAIKEFERQMKGDPSADPVILGVWSEADAWLDKMNRIWTNPNVKSEVKNKESEDQSTLIQARFDTLSQRYSAAVTRLFATAGLSAQLYAPSKVIGKETVTSREYVLDFKYLKPSGTLSSTEGGMACENAANGKDTPRNSVSWNREFVKSYTIQYVLNGQLRSDAYLCANGYYAFIYMKEKSLTPPIKYNEYYRTNYAASNPTYDDDSLGTVVKNWMHFIPAHLESRGTGAESDSWGQKGIVWFQSDQEIDRDCFSENCLSEKAQVLMKWISNIEAYFVRTYPYVANDPKKRQFILRSADFDTKQAKDLSSCGSVIPVATFRKPSV